MKIVWSVLAKDYYAFIIDQLFEKWTIDIVELFEKQTTELIYRIENHNHICPKSKIVNLYKCVLSEHISLIYRIQNNNIEIITFVFNQSEHLY